jgi:hypothetical protein
MTHDPHPTWRPVSEQSELNASHWNLTELPALGYPLGEEAVTHWFEKTYGRQPEPAEVGVIQERMAQRAAEQPAADPPDERVFEQR